MRVLNSSAEFTERKTESMSSDKPQTQLSERAQHLFKVLVEQYIADGTPVGSRTLARSAGLELSPATIRNVMADLEDFGLIKSPHTSAGRIPTVQGYRLFVDSMMQVRKLSVSEIRRITGDLEADDDEKRVLSRASTMLSDFTSLASIVMLPRTEHRALRQVEFLPLSDNRVLAILVINAKEVQNRIIQTSRKYSKAELEQAANYLNNAFAGKDLKSVRENLLKEMSSVRQEMNQMMQAVIEITQLAFEDPEDEDDLLVTGQTNLMGVNELSNVEKLRHLFDAFNQKRDILHLLDQALNAQGVQIYIGEESGYEPLDNCSVVTSTYEADGEVLGVLGVVGPTRMAYERVVPIVDMTAKILGSALKTQK